MIKRYGTASFSRARTSPARHLLEDHELCYARNVDYRKTGALTPYYEATLETALSSNTVAGGTVVESDGSLVYKHGQTVYAGDDAVEYASGNSNQMYAYSVGERVYMADSSQNMVWDGTSYRKHGPLEPDDTSSYGVYQAAPSSVGISGITKAAPAVVTTGSVHTLSDGDGIWIDGADMTEVNDRWFEVKVLTSTTFELVDEDSTNHTTWTAGGDVHLHACGRTSGIYKYAVSYQITMPSGDVIESSLTPITIAGAEEIDLSDIVTVEEDRVLVGVAGFNNLEINDYTTPASGDGFLIGTDITVVGRVWRTKDSGTTYYLMREIPHNTIYGFARVNQYDEKPDSALGAAWTEDADAHDTPPVSSMLVSAGNRLYCNDTSNNTRLYFSKLWDPDYFPPLNYIDMPAAITALGVYGDSVIVFSEDRMWRYNNTDGIGYLEEVDAPEGCPYRFTPVSTPYGLFYMGEQAAYVYQGTTPYSVSEDIRNIVNPYTSSRFPRAVYCNNRVYFQYLRSAGTVILDLMDKEPRWSDYYDSASGWVLYARKGDSMPYAHSDHGIYKLHDGSSADGYLWATTKQWGDGTPKRLLWVYVDMDATDADIKAGRAQDGTGGLTNGAPSSAQTLVEGVSTSGRQIKRYSVDDDFVGTYFHVEVRGSVTLYGVWIEVY